ncbi:MAG: hypothetical protein KGZ97_11635 [Bacteroidetes bacterium]|nr:hypothetical protein [Bacteroidota bacterium]
MKNLIFLILLFALIFLTGCPNDDPVKPDPCAGKKPVSAEIKVMQKVINYIESKDEWIETDTLPISKFVAFEAVGEYQYYEWQILGDTTKYYNRRQTFMFDKVWGELTIRLIVRNQPDTLCFPTDDGLDTAFKKIIVVKREDLAIYGSYYGYHEGNPLDTFTVDIKFEGGNRGLVMYNINRGCIIPLNIESPEVVVRNNFCNHTIIFNGEYPAFGCEMPTGRANLNIANNTLVIDYESGPANDRKQYKFIGVKK